ncbi:RHS repeat-associated core domain-containing protein [Anaeromicropila populeti]|uniref:RHS repeat-associated core domain-containing protein n=1 Tax=Anaeromicropila populeti TaxID=37658 RepID=A0A1I6IS13_9FIRM|nr:RHS repeat-associated core domain-containing protein [Anaeromicropila populeti]
MASTTDERGNTTTYEYDNNGKLIKEINPLGATKEYTFDSCGQLISYKDEADNVESYEYDLLGNKIKETDVNGNVTQYKYNIQGNIIEVIHPDGTTEEATYDGNSNMLSIQDGNGNIITSEYDNRNRLIQTVNAEQGEQHLKYAPCGKVSEFTDENGNITCYEFNFNNQLSKVIDPLGNKTMYQYDEIGNIKQIQQFKAITDNTITQMFADDQSKYASTQEELITEYNYDNRGLLVEEKSPTGKIKFYCYDGNSNLIAATDEDGNIINYSYDEADNLVSVQYSDGKSVQYEYNELNQITSMTDWNGITSYELDSLNRITSVTDYQYRTTDYEWTADGKKKMITYPDGSVVNYSYDNRNRLISVVDADNAETTYEYDNIGNLIKKVLPNGIRTEYSYNKLSYLTGLVDYTNNNQLLNQSAFTLDNVGNKMSIARNESDSTTVDVTSYTYDGLNQLTCAVSSTGIVRYFYDTLQNCIRQENWNDEQTFENSLEYEYNQENQLILLSGQTADIREEYANEPITMEYDNRGNIAEIYQDGSSVAAFTFNGQNRMSSSVNQFGMETEYSYDGNNKRIAMYIQLPEAEQPDSFLIDEEDSDEEKALKNSCNAIFDGVNYSKEYEYVNDSTSSADLVMLVYGEHNVTSRYVHGLGTISVDCTENETMDWDYSIGSYLEDSSAVKSYYLQNELGSTMNLTGEDETVLESYDYDIYGKPVTEGDENSFQKNIYGYAGYQYDVASHMYYVQARYYDSETAKFISQDVFKGIEEHPTTFNRYLYCENNSLRYIDKSGYSTLDTVVGLTLCLDETLDLGLAFDLTMEIISLCNDIDLSNYPYESQYDYYLGRVIGDAISIVWGAKECYKGYKKICTAIEVGDALTVCSGGWLTVAAMGITIVETESGVIEIANGGAVVFKGTGQIKCDWDKMMAAKGGSKDKSKGTSTINWKSVKQFGHTFSTHGSGAKNTKSLIDRSRSTGNNQGQWLNNQRAAEFLEFLGNITEPITVSIPKGLGQVITPTGNIVPATKAIVVPSATGIKTAFPIL